MDKYYTTLEDDLIILQPITREHITEMRTLSSDSDIWTWYTEDLTDPEDLDRWMSGRLKESENGTQFTFSVIMKETGKVIGSSSYGHIDREEKCIEIGWTWLGKEYIGSGINKHMKYLMLQNAFERMEVERLELRTDETNQRSRRAMEKIGATYDGVLRNHRRTQGDRRRNTVIYSIIREEWTEIKKSIFKEF